MTTQTLNLTPELYGYLLSNSLREPVILKELREETAKMPGSQMQISPEQGQFMRLLLHLIHARKTLDIGVFTGYSSLLAALTIPKDGKVIACDIDKTVTDIAKKYWKKANVEDKIALYLQPATETLQALLENNEDNTFDFIFIDADKANYSKYYEFAITLVRPGGLIVIDNVLWDGKVADPEIQDKSTNAIRELNKNVYSDDRVHISLVPIGDGIMLAMKRE